MRLLLLRSASGVLLLLYFHLQSPSREGLHFQRNREADIWLMLSIYFAGVTSFFFHFLSFFSQRSFCIVSDTFILEVMHAFPRIVIAAAFSLFTVRVYRIYCCVLCRVLSDNSRSCQCWLKSLVIDVMSMVIQAQQFCGNLTTLLCSKKSNEQLLFYAVLDKNYIWSFSQFFMYPRSSRRNSKWFTTITNEFPRIWRA